MIGFIIPNGGSTRPLQDFAVTVDALEKETGLDFFSLVPGQELDRLECTITLDAWKWSAAMSRNRETGNLENDGLNLTDAEGSAFRERRSGSARTVRRTE